MRLLVVFALACVAAAHASYIGLGGEGYGGRGSYSGREGYLGKGNVGGGYDYGKSGGSRRGYGESGYASGGSDRGRDFGSSNHDYKAVVEGHDSNIHDRSHDRNYMNRGQQSRGFGSSGGSEYGRGYSGIRV